MLTSTELNSWEIVWVIINCLFLTELSLGIFEENVFPLTFKATKKVLVGSNEEAEGVERKGRGGYGRSDRDGKDRRERGERGERGERSDR